MASEQELQAAAERFQNSGGFEASFPEDCIDDLHLLATYAVQRLTAPLPDDLEAELQQACVDSSNDSDEEERLLRRFRPLLQRAAGGRAEKRGLGGRRLCPKCGTEEGVHGGCSCGELRAWSSADSGVRTDGDHAIGIGDDEL